MDATAITKIQDTAIEASVCRATALATGTQIVLPVDNVIHDLEKYQPLRRRFRGQLTTDSLADFVSYVKRHGDEAAGIVAMGQGMAAPGFIDAEKLSACVLFNLGSVKEPGHADDRAALTLKPSAPYAALMAVNGKQLQQKDAIDWLEDWAENVEFRDDSGQALSSSAAIGAIRKITIRATAETTTTQENFRGTRSALEDVEARGAQSLPAEVLFTCTPYAGLASRVIRLRLAVLTSTDKPVLVLRVRNFEAEKEAIAQDFKRVLLTELEGAATLTIGTFNP